MSTTSLAAGAFFGQVDAAWRTDLVTLSRLRHAEPRQVPMHTHQRLFVALLLGGGYREWVGDRCYEYAPLTAVYHPEALEHRDEIVVAPSEFFIVEAAPALLDGRAALRSVHDLTGGPVVWRMLRLFEATRGGRGDALDAEEPVAEILDEIAGATVADEHGAPRWLARVEDRLQDGFRDRLSLGALGEVAGVHPVHVARVFRRAHGCSLRVHLQRLRVQHAGRAIATGTSLAAAAVESGFVDQPHMTHVFRAVTGMTPAAFRRARG